MKQETKLEVIAGRECILGTGVVWALSNGELLHIDEELDYRFRVQGNVYSKKEPHPIYIVTRTDVTLEVIEEAYRVIDGKVYRGDYTLIVEQVKPQGIRNLNRRYSKSLEDYRRYSKTLEDCFRY
jgi:hypothetical protein